MSYTIRPIQETDVPRLAHAFASWNKKPEQYERYWKENQEKKRMTLVALCDSEVAGYTNIIWQPEYEPFRTEWIPEINDMNVLIPFRKQGIATNFIAESERIVARAGCTVIGIGFGLTADYSSAQRLYAKLGYIPDGRGACPTLWGDVLYLTKSLVPSHQEKRYRTDMTQVRILLNQIVATEEAERWLYSPQTVLGGDTPRNLVLQNQTERVIQAVRTVAEGTHV